MIRIAIADDHQVIREGFSVILGAQPDLQVVLHAENGLELVQAVRGGAQLDIALVDIRMPVMDGLQATRELAELPGAPSVIVVTTFDDDAYVLDAIAAGACGFLLKRCSGNDLVTAVRAVVSGDSVLAPAVTGAVMARLRDRPDGAGSTLPAPADVSTFQLTPRETDVLTLIGEGLNNAEIAARLCLSPSTVKTHVGNVLAKTASRDRVRAALLAIQTGLVPGP